MPQPEKIRSRPIMVTGMLLRPKPTASARIPTTIKAMMTSYKGTNANLRRFGSRLNLILVFVGVLWFVVIDTESDGRW